MGIIYGLFDPRKTTDLGDCRYVGLTGDPADFRLSGHIREAESGSLRDVYVWIRTLLADGVNPTMVVLQDAVDDEELDASERSWIVAARYVGADLTNIRRGGRRLPPSKRRVVTQTVRTIEDPIAWRNLRIKEGHAKRDRTPTQCPQCDEGPFMGQFGVNRHIGIRHNDQEPTLCEECGSGPFRGQHGLHVHARHCGTEELLRCDQCDEGPFVGFTGLGAHRSHKHGDQPKELLMCECGAGPFMGVHGLGGHRSQVHNGAPETFCECGAGPFRGPAGLSNHLRYCGVDENLACEECEAGPFTSSSGLSTHERRMHSAKSREPMMCECGQGPFVGTTGLSTHQRQSCVLNTAC